MDIKNNIKSLREKKSISQQEMAKRLNLDQPSYSRLEKRGNKLSIEQLETIANALQVELKDIIVFKSSPNEINESSYFELISKNEVLTQELRVIKSTLADKDLLLEYANQKFINYQDFSTSLFEDLMVSIMFRLNIGSLKVLNVDTGSIEKEIRISNLTSLEEIKQEYQNAYLLNPGSDIYLNLSDEEEVIVFNGNDLLNSTEGKTVYQILENDLCKNKYPRFTERFKSINAAMLQSFRIQALKQKYSPKL